MDAPSPDDWRRPVAVGLAAVLLVVVIAVVGGPDAYILVNDLVGVAVVLLVCLLVFVWVVRYAVGRQAE